MTISATIVKNFRLGGASFPENKTITGDGQIVHDVSVPAAEAGSLTTRTNNTEGEVTVDDSGHSIGTGDRVDLYWTDGCRRGVTAGTVAGAVVPVSGGSGDNLPIEDSDITIVEPVELDISVLGTNVKAILLYTAARGQFVFEDVGGEELAKELKAAIAWVYHDESGEDNPITGDSIIAVYVSHDDTSNAKTMRVGIAHDND